MTKRSAGILLYRDRGAGREVLLIHPGGPFWRNKDRGAWQIPKGGIAEGESAAAAALREFAEELGTRPPGTPRPLGSIRQAGGKHVEAFALAGDLRVETLVSNLFELEWPPRSGRIEQHPEVDEARWFTLPDAREMMLPSQLPMLDALEALEG